ncbi:hypothetical protein [Vibrio phage J14]|nr:hypothetical protein [Vibrio phage J14]
MLANIEDVTHEVDEETDLATTELYVKGTDFMNLVASTVTRKDRKPRANGS